MDVAIQVKLDGNRALLDSNELFERLEDAQRSAAKLAIPPGFKTELTAASKAAADLANNISLAARAIFSLSSVTSQATTATNQGTAATVNYGNAIAAQIALLQQQAQATNQQTAAQRAATQAAQQAAAAANLPAQTANMTGLGGAINGVVGRMVSFAAGWLSIRTAIRLGEDIVKARIEMDRLEVGMRSIYPTSQQAASATAFLISETQRLGLELNTTIPEFVKISAAFQSSGMTANQAEKVFTDMSVATKALGLSSASTGRILYDFQEMASMGTVQMRQLRQVMMQMPGGLKIAADAMGVTTQKFHEMVQQGDIDPNEFILKFADKAADVYGRNLPEALDTLESHVNRLKNSWTLLLAEIGKSPSLKSGADFLNEGIQNMTTDMQMRSKGIDPFDKNSTAKINAQFPNSQPTPTQYTTNTPPASAFEKYVYDQNEYPVGDIGKNYQRQQSEEIAQQKASKDYDEFFAPKKEQPMTDKQTEALQKLADLRQKMEAQTLEGLQKELAQIDVNYQKQVEDITKLHEALGSKNDTVQQAADYIDAEMEKEAQRAAAVQKNKQQEIDLNAKINDLVNQGYAAESTGLTREFQQIAANGQRRIDELNRYFAELGTRAKPGEQSKDVGAINAQTLAQQQTAGRKALKGVEDQSGIKSQTGEAEELARATAEYQKQLDLLNEINTVVTVPQYVYEQIQKQLATETATIQQKYATSYVGETTLMGMEQKRLELEKQLLAVHQNDPAGKDQAANLQKQISAINQSTTEMIQTGQAGMVDSFNYGFQKVVDGWGNTTQAMVNMGAATANSISNDMTNGLVGWVTGTKTASQAFEQMSLQIINDLIKIAIQQLIVNQLVSGIAGVFGGTSTASLGMGGAGAFGGLGVTGGGASIMHDGGTVKGGGSYSMPSSLFVGAPRFHSGGMIGNDEQPIIAKKGEVMFTADQMKALGSAINGGQKRPTQIINATDPGMIGDYLAANPDAVLNIISKNARQIRRVVAN